MKQILILIAIGLMLVGCVPETVTPTPQSDCGLHVELIKSVAPMRDTLSPTWPYAYSWGIYVQDPVGPAYYNGEIVEEPWCPSSGMWRVTPRVDLNAAEHTFIVNGCKKIIHQTTFE